MKASVLDVILKKCLQVRPEESILVVTDTVMAEVGLEIYHAIRQIGMKVNLVSMEPMTTQGEEPPPVVAEAMKHCSVALLVTSKSLTHTQARREACERHGVRVVSMPGTDPGRLERLLDIDYDLLRSRCSRLSDILKKGKKVQLKTSRGTDLSMAIGQRQVISDDGSLHTPGRYGNMPCGEVYVSPIEGSANGIVVIDGSIASLGRLKDPVRMVFKDGYLSDVSDPRLEKLLKAHAREAGNLAEFGVGLNPRAKVVGNILEDGKAMGTAHIGLGDNISMGGSVRIPFHIDAILLNPEIEIDGQKIPEEILERKEGSSIYPAVVHRAGGISLDRSYKTLFDTVDLPQYVLDGVSQIFLEVNPAFERLTGYTLVELTAPTMDIYKLLTQESYLTYKQRQDQLTDRFEIKLLNKKGEKIPVELNFKKINLYGQETVVGTLLDMSRVKKVEQEMWERIQELGYANNRVFALTEKVRKVPEMMPRLLPITHESELLEKAAEFLCDRQGLAYQSVDIYLLKGQKLELAYSSSQAKKRAVAIESDSPLARILRGELPSVINAKEAILPLRGREHNNGIIEIGFDPKEMDLMKSNERALKGYQDLIETLASLMGLLIENLHLYETIKLQAIIDQLTGVFNRRYFDAKMVEEVGRAARYKRELSLLMVDVDHFKGVNDTYGHQQGDTVLQEVAQLIRTHSRDVDIICRYGGDEFAVLTPETSLAGAVAKAETLRKAVEDHKFTNVLGTDAKIRLTLSIGVAEFTKDTKTVDDLFKSSDDWMYEAKKEGRNRVRSPLPPESPGAKS